jgi:AsmA protein
VIADSDEREDYQSLRGFNGRMALSADQLQWRGLNFTQVQSEISNQQGLLTVSKMQGNLMAGSSLSRHPGCPRRRRWRRSSPNCRM